MGCATPVPTPEAKARPPLRQRWFTCWHSWLLLAQCGKCAAAAFLKSTCAADRQGGKQVSGGRQEGGARRWKDWAQGWVP
eukprot:10130758-Alexandrium_andersonii.AAC.1